MNETIIQILLLIHIIFGGLGLVVGSIVFFKKKGDKVHRILGLIFFWSMLLSGLSAISLALIKDKSFLFAVGAMTVYATLSGVRYLKMAKQQENIKPAIADWIISSSVLVCGGWFLYFGIQQFLKGASFGIVFIVFGTLTVLAFRQDLANYRGKSAFKNYALLMHIQRMGAAYIAAFTAFLVVNAHHIPLPLPGFVYWLLPAVLFSPILSRWTKKYRIKKA